jgi:pimeloyl-ACP methyl ester carboxylesterase
VERTALEFEVTGGIRSDLAPSRLWERQVDALAATPRVVAFVRPGVERRSRDIVGAADLADTHGIADRLAAGVPRARDEVAANAAHPLPLERPDELSRPLLELLA